MKKYKKRIISLFWVLCYVLGSMLSPSAVSENNKETVSVFQGASSVSDFLDVKKDDWYYQYLEVLVSNKIINGKSKTIFDPDGSFSFAECSAVITRYLGLENEADLRKAELEKSIGKTPEWFCGYMQIMYELNIFDESSGLFTLSDSLVNVNNENCSRPMKRHELACAISKSFELDGKNLRSKNLCPEISGLGHDFIVGGRYDNSYLNKYSDLINDFDTVPETSRQYVLKAYYNGIFNGDLLGNFKPNDNIKRCEIAKILAVIRDFGLRKFLIDDYCPSASEDKLFTDGAGRKTLQYQYAGEILQSCVSRFDFNGKILSYIQPSTVPCGYAVDIYIYSLEDTKLCKLQTQYTLSDVEVYNDGFSYEVSEGETLRAVLVLRNLMSEASVEFSLSATINDDGIVSKSMIYNQV